jgi:hypothetical protein
MEMSCEETEVIPMATFSLCMIVKNESKVLARCLDSVAHLMDEIIIVDTGSTDNTKEIALGYTDQVYDFPWQNDFAEARNFSFSKATMDYIYAPDADEVLDENNQAELMKLKQAILPEVEIVQMKYRTVTEFNTVLNAATEYRPKLFKRLRTFQWMEPVHETIRLDPVVFNSDIEILHMPEEMHSKRDFSIFEQIIEAQGSLSEKLLKMYAMELQKSGDLQDLQKAEAYFNDMLQQDSNTTHQEYAVCLLTKLYFLQHDTHAFFKVALKDMGKMPCSEVCFVLGRYFLVAGDVSEASLWFYNAAFMAEPVLDIHAGGDEAMIKLMSCYEKMIAETEDATTKDYYEGQLIWTKSQLDLWHLPEEK